MTTDYQRYSNRKGGALPLVVAGAALMLTLYLLWDRAFPVSLHGDAGPRVVAPRGELAAFEKSVIEVYQENVPSVVHITSPEVILRGYSGYAHLPEGTGSGFVWDDRGYVVTNYHVVRGREASTLLVRFFDHKEYDARIVDFDANLDIAVLKVLGLSGGVRPIPIGESRNLLVGQTVLAIGNPFGLDHTLTTGVISALDRTITSVEDTPIRGVIQVDAAINPGNSGGPLLDSAGRLIGMNTAITSPTRASAGIGFAVPVDTINSAVPRLIRGRKPPTEQAILGIIPQLVSVPELANERGQYRVMVATVSANSGAAAAGLRGEYRSGGRWFSGDIVLRVAGQDIHHRNDIHKALEQHAPGDKVQVEYVRGLPHRTSRHTVEVTLSRASDF